VHANKRRPHIFPMVRIIRNKKFDKIECQLVLNVLRKELKCVLLRYCHVICIVTLEVVLDWIVELLTTVTHDS
jgi:hypothetical protein